MDTSGKPGFIASSAAHAALLALALLSFSGNPKFEDAPETIPIELVSNTDFNQIMRGDKTAKEVKPLQRADKVADTVELKPKPPLAEAKRDVQTAASPLKKIDDPGDVDKAEPPKPDQAAAAPKPVKPVPVPPVADKPLPQDADATEPTPVPRPKIEPPKEKDQAKKPEPQFKLDQIAKLLEEDKSKVPPKPDATPAANPKSGNESQDPPHKFDAEDIARLLSKEAPQRKAATGKELQQMASLGSPTASAEKMSPSLQAQMEGWFQDHFRGCWIQPITIPSGPKYVPEIRVPLNLDGSLAEDPTLINPPDDPAWKPLAESAMRAVHECDPLPVPAEFKPYYDEWRDRVVRFNDEDM
jgi:colicin import membrane protein